MSNKIEERYILVCDQSFQFITVAGSSALGQCEIEYHGGGIIISQSCRKADRATGMDSD